MNHIWPSIMAKTQTELNQDLARLKNATSTVHLDIVDGQFANNKTFQFPFKLSKKFHYTAHLMVNHPEQWITKHGKKVDVIIFHPETVKDVFSLIKTVQSLKKKVGLALLPQTKVASVKKYLSQLDYLLILTVKPGFYHGKFLKSELKKIPEIRKINPHLKLIVDGGMNPQTIKQARTADYFVSGSYTTKAEYPRTRIKSLLEALNKRK